MEQATQVRSHRWRILAGTTALGLASLGFAGYVAAPAGASTDDPSARTTIVECTSGTVTQGDVQMSAAIAVRVPADVTLPELPGGCTVRTYQSSGPSRLHARGGGAARFGAGWGWASH